MNLASAYLAILAFFLCPRLVKTYDDLLPVSFFDPPSVFFEPPDMWSLSSMIRRHQEAIQNAFFHGASSPHCEVSNDADQFQLALDLPDAMSPEDLHVDFDEQTRLLTVSGHHEMTNDETGHRSVSRFSRSYTLDPFVEVDQLTATMKEGVLMVVAPKDTARMEHALRSIPVNSLDQSDPRLGEVVPKTAAIGDGSIPVIPLDMPDPHLDEEVPPKTAAIGDMDVPDMKDVVWDKFDPFHVKERVRKAQLHEKEEPVLGENPNERLKGPANTYKTSELRRR